MPLSFAKSTTFLNISPVSIVKSSLSLPIEVMLPSFKYASSEVIVLPAVVYADTIWAFKLSIPSFAHWSIGLLLPEPISSSNTIAIALTYLISTPSSTYSWSICGPIPPESNPFLPIGNVNVTSTPVSSWTCLIALALILLFSTFIPLPSISKSIVLKP